MKTNPGLSKILPMKDPRLTAYADTANIQAIVFNCKYSDDWYNNDFIQLYGYNRPLNGTVLISSKYTSKNESIAKSSLPPLYDVICRGSRSGSTLWIPALMIDVC